MANQLGVILLLNHKFVILPLQKLKKPKLEAYAKN